MLKNNKDINEKLPTYNIAGSFEEFSLSVNLFAYKLAFI